VLEHSRQDVARRAGVEPDYVDRLIGLGILTPGSGDMFSTGHVRQARWVRSLEESGVPLDGMAAAVRDGTLSFSFLDAPAFDRFEGISTTTFQEFSEKTGVPLGLLKVAREALGLSEPGPDDRVREDELSLVQAIETQLSEGIRPIAIERWLRVYADSLRRIVETETDWYEAEVMKPLLESGMAEREMLETQAEMGSRIAPSMDRALLAIYHGQQERSWRQSHMEHVEDVLEAAGLHHRLHRPPALCFLDITGYTKLTEERGDEAAANLAGRLSTLVRRTSQDHGGRPVKWLGDGVMFHFPDPARSVVAALSMVEGVASHGLPPAHVGIHAGPVIFQEGDYYGRTVNIAARIADYARPGEVLVTQEVVDLAGNAPVTFTDVGPVELKGLSGSPHLHSAHQA
jgi:adenylate cyclase